MTNELRVGFRDAIHVPFIVVTCKSDLEPGDKLSLRHDDKCVKWGGLPMEVYDEMYMGDNVEPMWHGVADPFLESTIPPGEPFRCMIRKECFRELRHDFQIEVHDRGGTETCHSVCDIF